MGCVISKQTVSVTPAIDHSGAFRDYSTFSSSNRSRRSGIDGFEEKRKKKKKIESWVNNENDVTDSISFRLGNLQKYVEGEQVAAGWPVWLSTVASEAIHGWLPISPDSYEKLEKIGQGTYSNVFRARDLKTNKIVALKKVRFDNLEPESVKFMAREITVLRRLDHPNIIKLEGLVASRSSCQIFLVFEYMEHDISALLSSPNISFNEEQVKCYMKQLLSGLEHCHSRGIMHRDIKAANLLVNKDGLLKVADFGLANFVNQNRFGHKPTLTSRVVTLWYRPPELLLGSTDYGVTIDLWSAGCVFAELMIGKPILQGRTEVEQLHKIFKLCGSPSEDYWKKSRLPHTAMFKPQHPYESCLRETFKNLPETAVELIETLLSFEPRKRGTAASALVSNYFSMNPCECDSSPLPKYVDLNRRQEQEQPRSVPELLGSSGFAWAKRRVKDSSVPAKRNDNIMIQRSRTKPRDKVSIHTMVRQLGWPDSYHSQELSQDLYQRRKRIGSVKFMFGF
ncbi:protein IMPAIRED IN BABA-INDUCED STERILITY 1-like isoform X2 [Impatiens glandulifera]|uniref:protein IMPAIRED IN BABA-INDUCED STERILITY 1-like isoform X2 n=1 Tax=Impatiens glandulifera TaxID=253017 RepID=UPI001FB08B0A|nr:protein IMPAIRED IN BABA-INDUCED STERILITY 1-like isoform X2 [Impatiens glandulifera]